MAKAKTKKVEMTEQERQAACLNEINEVLKKYKYALVPFNQPSFKLVPVKDEQEKPAQ